MKNYLGFLHFSQSLGQFIGVFWILVSSELSGDLLDTHVVISLELSPFLPILFEENIQNFVQKPKDNPLRISLTDKGICSHRFVGHLNMNDFIIMSDSISGILSNARKRLSDNKLKGVLDLVSHQKTDVRHFVISMNDTDLLLIIFHSYHA